jgi:hypothetical protein
MLRVMREERRGVPGLLQHERVDHDPADNPGAGKPRHYCSKALF